MVRPVQPSLQSQEWDRGSIDNVTFKNRITDIGIPSAEGGRRGSQAAAVGSSPSAGRLGRTRNTNLWINEKAQENCYTQQTIVERCTKRRISDELHRIIDMHDNSRALSFSKVALLKPL